MPASPNVATPVHSGVRIDSPVIAQTRTSGPRLSGIDIVRGVVMVLMAIDHVRVYSGVPAGGPTPGIFFTRWITHFCAPAFVFFAGTAAFLHGRKLGDTRALSRYLWTRGLLLVALELTLIHVSWTFTFQFTQLLAGVIWMLGWCMVMMAALVRFAPRAVGIFGLAVVFLQQLVGLIGNNLPSAAKGALGWLFQFLYLGGEVHVGASGPTLGILYVLVPWIGVMAAGYGFGLIVVQDADARRRLCLRIGLAATALFLVAGCALVLSRTAPPNAPPFYIRLLNQQKYPASQLFLLMTLGPTIALLPLAERARGWFADVMLTFGRVPMFYYLLHIPLIHAISLVVWTLRTGNSHAGPLSSAPYVGIPPAERWSLALLYLVFVLAVAILYVPCRWYAKLKARSSSPWLRYI